MAPPSAIVWVGFLLLNLELAALVAVVRPRRPANMLLAALFAANALGSPLVFLSEPFGPLPAVPFERVGRVFDALTIVPLLTLPFLFPRVRVAGGALVGVFAGAALFTGVAYAALPASPVPPTTWRDVASFSVLTVAFRTLLAGASIAFLAATLDADEPGERRGSLLVLAAYLLGQVALLAVRPPFAAPFPPLAGDGPVLAGAIAVYAAFVVTIFPLVAAPLAIVARAWRARGTPDGRAAIGALGALAVVAALGVLASRLEGTDVYSFLLVRPLLFTYAIVQYRTLDVELRARWGILVALILTVFSTVLVDGATRLDDALRAPALAVTLAFLAAMASAALLLLPIARRLLASPAASALRDRILYRDMLEEAFRAERAREPATSAGRLLESLRGRIGISDREHAVLEAEAREAAGFGPELRAPGGLVLHRYRVEAILGEGGFGRALRAKDETVGRTVVLKVARSDGSADAARLEREARALARLSHPAIVTLYDVERVGNDVLLVMEHAPGGSLAERLARGPLPSSEVATIASDLLDALATAHEAGVVHRDVKPGNVLFDARGRAKLADFGIARVSGSGTAHGLSLGGADAGTVRYMSPEQVRGGDLDGRTDLYSLGATLHEALTGRSYLDFDGRGDFDARLAILREEPDLADAPAEWRGPLAVLLAKDRASRPRDARAARAALAALGAGAR